MKHLAFSTLALGKFTSTVMPQRSSILKGVCKRFNGNKGFGFITCDDGSGDVFVHFSEINAQGFKKLNVGDTVEFKVVKEGGRRKAVNVTGPGGALLKNNKESQGGGPIHLSVTICFFYPVECSLMSHHRHFVI